MQRLRLLQSDYSHRKRLRWPVHFKLCAAGAWAGMADVLTGNTTLFYSVFLRSFRRRWIQWGCCLVGRSVQHSDTAGTIFSGVDEVGLPHRRPTGYIRSNTCRKARECLHRELDLGEGNATFGVPRLWGGLESRGDGASVSMPVLPRATPAQSVIPDSNCFAGPRSRLEFRSSTENTSRRLLTALLYCCLPCDRIGVSPRYQDCAP